MTDDAEAIAVGEPNPADPEFALAETGNFPPPEDGAQDDVEQTALPQYDEDLIDGADLTPEEAMQDAPEPEQ
jgi:hypothetical protein